MITQLAGEGGKVPNVHEEETMSRVLQHNEGSQDGDSTDHDSRRTQASGAVAV